MTNEGEMIDVMTLPEDVAVAIIGRPLYEALKSAPKTLEGGSYTVTKVDQAKRSITLRFSP